MGLFGKKEKDDAKVGTFYHTNAPANWPKVPIPQSLIDGNHDQSMLDFGRALNSALKGSKCGAELRAMAVSQLEEQGVVDFPFVALEGKRPAVIAHYPVFTEELAARYNGLRQFVAKDGINAYYFSPGPIPTEKVGTPFREMEFYDFAKFEGDIPQDRYAMWWSAEGQPKFGDSKTMAYIDQFVESIDGYRTYFFGMALANMGLIEKPARVTIPEETTVPFKGPGGQIILMDANTEKGIRFMFPINDCKPEYRDNFWKAAAALGKSFRKVCEEEGWKKDDPHPDYSPLRWWKFAMRSVREQIEDTVQFGLIIFDSTTEQNGK